MVVPMVIILVVVGSCHGVISDEQEAQRWAEQYNTEAQKVYNMYVTARWDYYTNMTDHNQDRTVEASLQRSFFEKEVGQNASLFDWRNFQNATLRRLFNEISVIGIAILDENDVQKSDELGIEMQRIYSTGEVCLGDGSCLTLDPDMTRMFTTSRDYEELEKAWKGWRDVTGRRMRNMYQDFVKLENKAAKLNGFSDNGEYWRSSYEMSGFEEYVLRLWEEVKPLYTQLHAYVRRKLQEAYSDHQFPATGHIPAHLLSNMWAQSWSGIYDLVRPFPNSTGADVTQAMQNQGYDTQRIIELSESFFTSLGLDAMPASFWEKSMLERPDDGRDVVCHASAWDFADRQDFRIKQCTDITTDWLLTTHHEMGHVQYYLQYKHLPVTFRGGANPGFHEAVGDVMALSVSTPEHLKEIGLLEEVSTDEGSDLNFLMQQALEKVAFLPFGFLIDQWRWDVFSGHTTPRQYNEHWWKYRCGIQGVSPPVTRSEEDFDAGAKFHIPGNTPYIRYFVSYILQFQLQKALCQEAGNTRPLHRCDIYNSRAAGQKLSDMLKVGSSIPWPETLKKMTGSEDMDAQPLLEYFQPLYDWLLAENEGHPVGWDEQCPPGTIEASGAYQMTSYHALITAALLVMCSLV